MNIHIVQAASKSFTFGRQSDVKVTHAEVGLSLKSDIRYQTHVLSS